MLAYNPTERFSIADIKLHPWFNGVLSDTLTISQELSNRRFVSLQKAEQARDLRQRAGANSSIVYNHNKFYRGDSSENSGLSLSFSIHPENLDVAKLADNFEAVNKYSQILTGLLPSEAMLIISHILASHEPECETSPDSYDVKVSIITETDSISFKISIYECQNDLFMINFKQKEGNPFDFMQIFNSILENIEKTNEN